MKVLDDVAAWREEFEANWLKLYQETGETNFKIYNRPKNSEAPSGKGIDVANSRILLISSAGSYLKDSQPRYDAENDLGDFSIRTYPSSTPFEDIAFAHTHYDHKWVDADPQVLLPLRHMEDMVAEGLIGEVAETVVSFMGYLPEVDRLIGETIPHIVEAAKQAKVKGALLVPA